jgi:phytoene synthase
LSRSAAEQSSSPTVVAAYEACKAIAKREAKNFYYAFRVLPQHKRDAMCAIYAFMRRADDIADDESMSITERRVAMQMWLTEWRASSRDREDPVFLAVRDTQRRFAIADELLEQLVRGTTMDLEKSTDGVVAVSQTLIAGAGTTALDAFQIYERFEDLYRYCYLVASVVGLVCIRIFGYTDPRAELLAEKVGIAFQLTNILRDVKEDAERHRIYLPLEDLEASHVEVEHLILTAMGVMPPPTLVPLLKLEADRAHDYYRAADELIPLLDADSRAAMWVLVTIYRELLKRIVASGYDVFTERVSVPSSRKLAILARGAVKSLGNRVLD